MAKRPQYRGGYGGPNMNQQASLMRQAQKMQEDLMKAQEELEKSSSPPRPAAVSLPQPSAASTSCWPLRLLRTQWIPTMWRCSRI